METAYRGRHYKWNASLSWAPQSLLHYQFTLYVLSVCITACEQRAEWTVSQLSQWKELGRTESQGLRLHWITLKTLWAFLKERAQNNQAQYMYLEGTFLILTELVTLGDNLRKAAGLRKNMTGMDWEHWAGCLKSPTHSQRSETGKLKASGGKEWEQWAGCLC